MRKNKSAGAAAFLEEALKLSDSTPEKSKFRRSILNELAAKKTWARMLKRNVKPAEIVNFLIHLPKIFYEPESDGLFYTSNNDINLRLSHASKIQKAVENLRELIEAKDDKKIPIDDLKDKTEFADLYISLSHAMGSDFRMSITHQIPLKGNIDHQTVSDVLEVYTRALIEWQREVKKHNRMIADSHPEKTQRPFRSQNKKLALLMQAIEFQIGPNHPTLAREIYNTKAVQELLGINRQATAETTKRIKKALKAIQ